MTMHPADHTDLAKQVDGALRALPTPKAPRTLVPRVMAAVELSLAPWYRRAWVTWPAVWQVASAAALALLVVAFWSLARLGSEAGAVADIIGSRATVAMPGSLVTFVTWAGSLIDASRILWRVIVEPILGYVVMFIVVMSVACVAFGTALNRVALGGASDL
jgi:hypothetical protein